MHPRCVLIVDGDLDNQIELASRLQSLGGVVVYQIDSSDKLFQGIASKSLDNPDLVIVDEHVPGMSGLSIVEKLLSQESIDCPIILVSENNVTGSRRFSTMPRPTTENEWVIFMQRVDSILLRRDIREDVSQEIKDLRVWVDNRLATIEGKPKTYADVLHRVYVDIKESPRWATLVAGVMAGLLGVIAMAVTKILK